MTLEASVEYESAQRDRLNLRQAKHESQLRDAGLLDLSDVHENPGELELQEESISGKKQKIEKGRSISFQTDKSRI